MVTSALDSLIVDKLERLRERLHRLGERPSMRFPSASPDLIEVMTVLERYGAMCEAMYLMMAADGKVLNVEREVLRGALEIVADGTVRTAHMEAMLDAAARKVATEGVDARLEAVVHALSADTIKAELTLVLCAAIAVADRKLPDSERALYHRLASGLEIDAERANQLLQELAQG